MDIIDKVFEVHSIRPVRRVGPGGQLLVDLLVEITQRRPGFKSGMLKPWGDINNIDEPYFWFRGGCTLMIDMKTTQVRYCIHKDIEDEQRYFKQQMFYARFRQPASLRATYFNDYDQDIEDNLFACLHRSGETMEVQE